MQNGLTGRGGGSVGRRFQRMQNFAAEVPGPPFAHFGDVSQRLDGVIRARLAVEDGGGRRKIVVEADGEDEELREALLPLSAQEN